MAFWCQIGPKRFGRLSLQLRNWHSLSSGARSPIHRPDRYWMTGVVENLRSCPLAFRSPVVGHQFASVRYFAAPTSGKKVLEKDTNGPRTNEEITAQYVRLVADEGHGIVTRREALNRAKALDLDLVEVDCKADPPVCKLMDFHKEKFKKVVKDKEHAKSKAETTVRKGDCKEVHFTGKIEQKDLQMKAETVKRLMERGYRVKVVAEAGKKAGTSGAEGEDLGSVLSRLYTLIEDVSALESAPRVEKRMAYLVVRHAKFGTKKNPPKKTSDSNETKNSDIQVGSIPTAAVNSNSKQALDALKKTNSSLGTTDKFSDVQRIPCGGNLNIRFPSKESDGMKPHYPKFPAASGVNVSVSNGRHSDSKPAIGAVKAKMDSKGEPRDGSIPSDPSPVKSEPLPVLSNRYKRSEANGRQSGGRVPLQPSFDKGRNHGQFDPKQRHFPSDPNFRGRSPMQIPLDKAQKHDQLNAKHQDSVPRDSGSSSTSFGIFSAKSASSTE